MPYRIPKLGHALALGRDPTGFLRECQQRYGKMFTLQLPVGKQSFLTDPHSYPAFFKDKRLTFRPVGTEMGSRWFGYDPDKCRVDIGAMTHHTGRQLAGSELMPLTDAVQRELNDRLKPPSSDGSSDGSAEHALFDWLSDILFGSGIDALFGTGFATPQIRHDYTVVDRSILALSVGVPPWLIRGYRKSVDRLARTTSKTCPNRSKVMQSRTEEYEEAGTPEYQRQRMDVAWLWASQVNTIVGAFWTLLHIMRDPEAYRALDAEASEVMRDRDLAEEPLNKKELKQLARLDSTIWEVLRLTSSSIIIRRAAETFDFECSDGTTYHIEDGDYVNVFSGTTHFDPEIFEDPEAFRYDRFYSEGSPVTFSKGGKRLQFPLLPFGSGASMCPGRFFAINELKVLIGVLLTRYEFELAEDRLPQQDYSRMGLGILPPKSDAKFRVTPR